LKIQSRTVIAVFCSISQLSGTMPRNVRSKQLNYREGAASPQDTHNGATVSKPFWKVKALDEMSALEWESLCDGCGQCCLIKLEDEDTGDIAITRLACRLLDIGSCRCSKYEHRRKHVSDCVKLEPGDIARWDWLPDTCAYRLVGEGRDLLWWHPLVSGSRETVHEAGVSVRSFAKSEAKVPQSRYAFHISSWIKRS
jgi:uncharacterized protein